MLPPPRLLIHRKCRGDKIGQEATLRELRQWPQVPRDPIFLRGEALQLLAKGEATVVSIDGISAYDFISREPWDQQELRATKRFSHS